MDDEVYTEIFYSRYFRVYWNEILLLGVGFDFENMIVGIHIAAWTIMIGDNERDDES